MKKIIFRYILREISYPFLMILFVLTFVLIMGKLLQLMELMVNKGVSFIDISKLFLLLFPSFLIFTIPISILISILIGLGRLSADNEITIFKASGLSLYQILYPVLFASLIAFIMTTISTFFLVPQSNYATRHLLFNIAKQKASIGIQEKVFNDDFNGILLYADSIPVSGNFMEGVLISDTRLTNEPSTIIAKKAYLVSDPNQMTVTLRLENGSSHMVDTTLKNYRKMDFRFYDINLNLESSIAEANKIKTKTSTELTILEKAETLKSNTLDDQSALDLKIELNKSVALPVSCIVMGILAIPLGIRSNRSVKSRGFTLGLMIVLIYYFLILNGETLAETGKLTPFLGIWMPNFLFGIIGIYLLMRAAKDKIINIPYLSTLRDKVSIKMGRYRS
jgi:lipopolysaccharide export system permease protein